MKKTLLLAHRGFSGLYPENSPIAFEKAVELTDCDGFESDVHITKDGKLVVFHDPTLERTSNGKGYIKDHTFDELLQLDIGSWKSPEFAGQHVWDFDQLLDFCEQTHKILNMELKNYEIFYDGLEEKVIEAIVRHKMQDKVFVSSFNHVSMQRFKTLNSDIKTGLLYERPMYDMDNYLDASNADYVHPKYLMLQYQPELVNLFHRRGMDINVWTVNSENDMRQMLDMKVDGIISNYPDILCRVAKEFA